MDGRPTIQEVIPHDYLTELTQLREGIQYSMWRVGDIANEIGEVSLGMKNTPTRELIYSHVAQVIGKSARSVRQYATVAAFFPVGIREAFPILPFAHFAYAMSLGNEIDPSSGLPFWQVILEASMNDFERYGIPSSVDSLKERFKAEAERYDMAKHGRESASTDPFDQFVDNSQAEYVAPISPEDIRAENLQALMGMINGAKSVIRNANFLAATKGFDGLVNMAIEMATLGENILYTVMRDTDDPKLRSFAEKALMTSNASNMIPRGVDSDREVIYN